VRYAKRVSAFLSVAAFCLSANALAESPKYDPGKREYMSNCSSCHGDTGKGNGPYVELLKTSPPDLTTLAKRNGGVFPINRVYMIIDGRETIRWHGPREMPVWGDDYVAAAGKEVEFYTLATPEAAARSRILLLVDYLYRIQEK
jgi:mono/diheme cytochrome c family protein